MRSMNLVLAMAGAQLCTFGTIATLLAGCADPSRNPVDSGGESGGNRIPTISSLTATPTRIVVGGTATIRAQATDPDADPITWSLVLGPADFPADGGFNPREGAGGNISSTFTATRLGNAAVKLTIFDGRGGIVDTTVLIQVSGIDGPQAGGSSGPR